MMAAGLALGGLIPVAGLKRAIIPPDVFDGLSEDGKSSD